MEFRIPFVFKVVIYLAALAFLVSGLVGLMNAINAAMGFNPLQKAALLVGTGLILLYVSQKF